jgi:hypothetical protein
LVISDFLHVPGIGREKWKERFSACVDCMRNLILFTVNLMFAGSTNKAREHARVISTIEVEALEPPIAERIEEELLQTDSNHGLKVSD